MQRTTHLVITHARPDGPRCAEALAALQLPQLSALLRTMQPQAAVADQPEQLSPAAERAVAEALQLPVTDGLIPWAARQALQQHLPHAVENAWASITPCHWEIATDHVQMPDPATLKLEEEESRSLMTAMQPWFAEDGIRLHFVSSLCWLAEGEPLRDLPTASLQRVREQAVDDWMPASAVLRRLQNEMQMLLYTHPVNDDRATRRQRAINSFWISGTGSLPSGWQEPAGVVWEQRLDAPSLADDPAEWSAIWHDINNTVLANLRRQASEAPETPLRITLCSDNSTLRLDSTAPTFWQRLQGRLSPPDARTLLNRL